MNVERFLDDGVNLFSCGSSSRISYLQAAIYSGGPVTFGQAAGCGGASIATARAGPRGIPDPKNQFRHPTGHTRWSSINF